MKLKVVNTKNEHVADITLKKELAEAKVNIEALTQYLRAFMANQRQGTASAKTRAEVSGSGIKPWRQKGTGRARVGDKRTPLWRHGGIVHAPKPKNWNVTLNKNAKQLALVSALADKFQTGNFIVIDSFDGFGDKTKENAAHLKTLDLVRNILVVSTSASKNMLKGLTNIKGVTGSVIDNLNAHEVFKANKVLISKEALESLEKKIGKK